MSYMNSLKLIFGLAMGKSICMYLQFSEAKI